MILLHYRRYKVFASPAGIPYTFTQFGPSICALLARSRERLRNNSLAGGGRQTQYLQSYEPGGAKADSNVFRELMVANGNL